MIITKCEACACYVNVEKMHQVTLLVRRPEGMALANEAVAGMMDALAKVAPPGVISMSDHEDPKSAPLAVNAVLCGPCYREMIDSDDGKIEMKPNWEVESE